MLVVTGAKDTFGYGHDVHAPVIKTAEDSAVLPMGLRLVQQCKYCGPLCHGVLGRSSWAAAWIRAVSPYTPQPMSPLVPVAHSSTTFLLVLFLNVSFLTKVLSFNQHTSTCFAVHSSRNTRRIAYSMSTLTS